MPESPDYDSAWKNALDSYFEDFMALLWPQLHALIDWTHPSVFLDKELQRLVGSAKHGRLHVDKLVRVRLLTGHALLALIHTEIQGRGESEAKLPGRMFHYHIRLREKHPQQSLVSLAVLTHRGDGPATQTYAYEHWGCSMAFSFPVVNLESWRPRIAELQHRAPHNPFAVVVLAQLEANARHSSPVQLVRKTELVRRLHHWGFDREQIVRLFTIMDAMLVLPESLEEAFVAAVDQIQEEHHMTYVNTIERVARRRERQEGKLEGKQEGKQEGAAGLLAMQITQRFGKLPSWAETRLAHADESTLTRWARQILTAQRIEDVFV